MEMGVEQEICIRLVEWILLKLSLEAFNLDTKRSCS